MLSVLRRFAKRIVPNQWLYRRALILYYRRWTGLWYPRRLRFEYRVYGNSFPRHLLSKLCRTIMGNPAKRLILWKIALRRYPELEIGYPRCLDKCSVIDKLKGIPSIEVHCLTIDKRQYEDYLRMAEYHDVTCNRAYREPGMMAKKSFEHFISVLLLNISQDDVCVDIASEMSPFPEIVEKLYKCKVYRQDIDYRPGVKDMAIGGNAAKLPVGDGFFSKMTLHCSFEHFEQNSDVLFIREASRVLRSGGRLCIVPLYLSETYWNTTDPSLWGEGGPVQFDGGASVMHNWNETRFARYYSVEAFEDRIVRNAGAFDIKIYNILNEEEINPSAPVKFVALFIKR